MKLTIERAQLLKSLAHVQSVVERRNTIPILSNVLIEAKGEHLHLMATDMDLTIVEQVEARVAQAGAVTAPAHTLYDIVRKLPEGAEVVLDVPGDQGQLVLKSGRSKFALATLPKEDFPAMGGSELPSRFQLQAGELRSL
ncbi:MAG: DNA polymerase III subunit beta, partial [Dongiaceae bacterium]